MQSRRGSRLKLSQTCYKGKRAAGLSQLQGRRPAYLTINALHYRTRYSTWPNCTGLPFSATISAITPFVSALISFITFIASIIHTTVSSFTSLPTSTNGDASDQAATQNVQTHG